MDRWMDGWLDGWMNEWRGLLGSWRGPHGRLDPLDQRSLVRPGGPQPREPVDDTMSGVPTTEKCLLPRVVMRCPLLRVRGLWLWGAGGKPVRSEATRWKYDHWLSTANRVSSLTGLARSFDAPLASVGFPVTSLVILNAQRVAPGLSTFNDEAKWGIVWHQRAMATQGGTAHLVNCVARWREKFRGTHERQDWAIIFQWVCSSSTRSSSSNGTLVWAYGHCTLRWAKTG